MNHYLLPEKIHDGHKFWPEGSVLMISEEGEVIDIILPDRVNQAWELVRMEGWLCPGFVNAHTHLELSHLKGKIQRGTGLMSFVGQVVRQRDWSPQEKRALMQQEFQKMLDSGVVAIGDICNTSDAFPEHQRDGIYVHAFMEALGFNQEDAKERISIVQDLATIHQKSMQGKRGIKTCSVVPHAPYSISDHLMSLINQEAKGKVLSIHNQELAAENEFFQFKTGPILDLHQKMRINNAWFVAQNQHSLPVVWKQLNQAEHVLLVHNTFTTEQDILDIIQEEGPDPFWVICIRANQYIENALPPIPLLKRLEQTICIGTDSLASNDSLSVWDELLEIKESFSAITWEELIQWATYNGAKALKMDRAIGSFNQGTFPGIVHIQNNQSKLIYKSR